MKAPHCPRVRFKLGKLRRFSQSGRFTHDFKLLKTKVHIHESGLGPFVTFVELLEHGIQFSGDVVRSVSKCFMCLKIFLAVLFTVLHSLEQYMAG